MNEEILHEMNRKLDVLLSLVARSVFDEEYISNVVTYRKREPEKYLTGYNALDGTVSVTEVAEIIGVTHSTLSPILKEWEMKGIIFKTTREGGTFYKNIYPLSEVSWI